MAGYRHDGPADNSAGNDGGLFGAAIPAFLAAE
jgi:hypothetical protein